MRPSLHNRGNGRELKCIRDGLARQTGGGQPYKMLQDIDLLESKFSLRVALKLRFRTEYYNWGTNGHSGKHPAAAYRYHADL
jgi:hypothetical protein